MSHNSQPQQQSIGGDNEDEASSLVSTKQCSVVWDYFSKLPAEPDGALKASCNACGIVYSANPNDGTSNMKRHIPKCFDLSEPGPPRKRVCLDQEMYREKMAIAIIKHNYPFSFVEHDATRDLHKFLHRDVVSITRNTAKADVLKIHEREKVALKQSLEKVTSRVCLTADLWSSVTMDGYMAMTAHYIDDDWILRKRVLNFRDITPPHSGPLLEEYIIKFSADWGIEKKIFSITLDNATYNDGLVDTLKSHLQLSGALVCNGDFMHVRCGAHVLNLIVQAGLKVIKGSISKIRDFVRYVRGGFVRKCKFAECISYLSLQCGKRVRQDITTRWNSTYLMLENALCYRLAYARLALVDSAFTTNPSQEEWTRVERITRFLKPFYDITTLFSGSSYPTSNLYFRKVWEIQLLIEEELYNQDPVISNMAKEMKVKFDKYWKSYSMILAFAVILDPRYKFKLVEYCFSKLDMTVVVRERKLDDILTNLEKVYNDYEILSEAIHDASSRGRSNAGANVSDDLEGYDSFNSRFRRGGRSNRSQLQMYLEEPEVDRRNDFDILQFWKDNQGRYPQLALMARDILSIPITTVASESSFSIGGRIVNKYRSSLLPSNVEALLCTRDWLFDWEDEDENGEELGEDVEALIPTLNSGNY